MQRKPNVKQIGRALLITVLGIAACLGLLSAGGPASAGVPAGIPSAAQAVSKIEPLVLQETADGKSASVMVLLADQADVSAAYAMRDHDARGWYVYNTLRTHADKSQQALRAYLDSQGISYRSFWVANTIEMRGDRALVEALAARDDVAKIESNRPSRWIEEPEVANADISVSPHVPGAIEWGVQNVNAPQVWAMGYTGAGMVVGDLDTGVRWTHQSIRSQYRGWDGTTANHNYNWWDAIHSGGGICGPNTQAPCDDNGHGTHTTGTIVGDDGGTNQIGVAPGAKWIGCRNMDVGNGTPATYTECFQFTIAPTDLAGQNPNPALRPHVLNNSWGCPPSEGCAAGTLQQIVENTQAAGILVEASAGNAGSACSTVRDPIAIYEASFTTGSITINNTISSFSSRGPVTIDGSNRLKPNLVAPGSNVRSATNASDTSYANFSGTSMAGPHVVGVIALLWDAHPALERDITGTKMLLQNSANPAVTVSPVQTCGGIPSTTIPNNSFGYGRVDALAAVNMAGGGTPTPGAATATVGAPTSTVAAPTSTIPVVASPTVCVPGGGGAWTERAVHPTLRTRAVGVTSGTDIYLFGGRPVSTSYDQSIYRYSTTSDSWTLLTQQVPDNMSSNMAGGLLTFPEGERIFIAGGSGPGSVIASRTFTFDTSTGTITPKASWPASPAVIPGGWAVANNKLYIFGGYDPAVPGVTTDIWMYDPMTDAWTDTGADLSVARSYIATETMPDGMIYVAGGFIPEDGVFIDDPTFEKFNPTNNTITTGPALPAPRSNNHGYNMAGKFVVPMGGIEDANHTTDVYVYDPATNLWSTTTPGLYATRNYAKGYGADGSIYVIGGNNPQGGTIYNYNQRFTMTAGGPCPTVVVPSPTMVMPTATSPMASATSTAAAATATSTTVAATATSMPPATATPCTITFTDVDEDNPFYTWIRCLACRGIISGYDDGTFRPFADITRGQIAKVVSNAAGFSEPPGPQLFEDVAPGSPFYDFINRLTMRGHMTGYECGQLPTEPCIEPGNLPYFRPQNNATRGQLSQIVARAAGLTGDPEEQYYADVPTSHTFYLPIMRLTKLGVMGGYPCGEPGEPCDGQSRPYFRPFANVTRGQASKIVANTFYPDCVTPQRAESR